MDYKKVMIIGNNGSGKSYMAQKLSEITNLPLVHLDMLFWKPGWETPAYEDWVQLQNSIVQKDMWIIDGNHTSTLEIRFQAADLIVFLDFNRIVCLKNVIKRTTKRREDSPDYLDYSINKAFWKFCFRLWTFPRNRRKTIIELIEKYKGKQIIIIKNKRQMKTFLLALERKEKNIYDKFKYRF